MLHEIKMMDIMNMKANTEFNEVAGVELDASQIASLESWLENNVSVGITLVEKFDASDCLKFVNDEIKRLLVIIALRKTTKVQVNKKTGEFSEAWNIQKAALALGITHSQMIASIKKYELEPPKMPDNQMDIFQSGHQAESSIDGDPLYA